MRTDTAYDADYYLRGKESGKSLYQNYRWLPELTIPMAQRIVDHLGIRRTDSILDFGCARGYMVKAFRELGFDAFGIDASQWAIENCDPDVRGLVSYRTSTIGIQHDWIIAKDVLEHVPNLLPTINSLQASANLGVFAVVPLANSSGEQYVVKEYEADVTHVHRLPLATWSGYFMAPTWAVDARYRIRGIKDNYYKVGWETGNGFITSVRI